MGAAEYTFGYVADARLAPTGEVYVLDSQGGIVRVYDVDGKHLRSFGRSGDGPGEFRFATRLQIDSQEITVFDPRQDRYSRFRLDGTHVETARNPPHPPGIDYVLPLRYGLWFGATTSRMTVSGVERLFESSRAEVIRRTPEFRRANQWVAGTFTDATSLDTIASYDNGVVWMVMPSGPRGFEPVTSEPWGRGGCFAVAGDSMVATVDAYRGNVRIFTVTTGGVVLRKAGRLPVMPQELTESDWRSAATAALRDRPLAESTHVVGPPFIARLGTCLFDDSGALWVARATPVEPNAPQERSYLVIPSGDGRQRSVVVPSGFALLDVRGDLLLGRRTGEFGTHLVEVLRIRQQ